MNTGAAGIDRQDLMRDVVIYTRDFCGYCSAARSLLERKGIRFTEHNATREPSVRQEMIERSGRYTFPQIFVGDTHVGGCDDLHDLERRGGLDALVVG
jgi:glutaredoxin 3